MRYLSLILLLITICSAKLSEDCKNAFSNEVNSLNEGGVKAMINSAIFNTGFGFNDLGKYDGCRNTTNKKYLLGKGPFKPSPDIDYRVKFFLGLCLPIECTTEPNLEYMADSIKNAGIVQFDHFAFEDPEEVNKKHQDWNVARIIVFTILGVLLLICLGVHKIFLGSGSDGESILDCLDPSRNFKLIFADRQGDPTLAAVDGVRIILATSIVIGHINNTVLNLPVRNMQAVLDNIKSFWWQIIYNSFYSVDTFFFLSGFFMAYSVVGRFKEISFWKAVEISKLRFLRLYPVYAAIFLIYWQVLPMLMNGPVAGQQFNENYENCNIEAPYILTLTQIWIYNFDTTDEGCAGWYWYLPNDFYCSVIAIFLLSIYLRNKKQFWTACAFLMVTLTVVEAWMTLHYKVGVNILEWGEIDRFFDVYYSKLYIRAAPYFIGMMLGIVFKNYLIDEKEGNPSATRDLFNKIKKSEFLAVTLFLIGFGGMMFLIFIIYPSYTNPWSTPVKVLYNVLNKKLFVLFFFCWLLPVVMGRFELVNEALGSYFFVPLSKLSYCVYLLHPLVEKTILFNTRSNITFSLLWFLLYAISSVVISFLLAIPVSMLFEMPLQAYRVLLSKKAKRAKEIREKSINNQEDTVAEKDESLLSKDDTLTEKDQPTTINEGK